LCCCKVLQEKLKEQIKDVDAAKSKEVSLFWCGMAEVRMQETTIFLRNCTDKSGFQNILSNVKEFGGGITSSHKDSSIFRVYK